MAGHERDLLGRLLRDRPEGLARAALGSWAVVGIWGVFRWRTGGGGGLWPLLIIPIVVTMVASMALIRRDPERAAMDAFRSAMLAVIPTALVVGSAAVRVYESPRAGHVATVCMAGASVGLVVGAVAGPVAGWAVRGLARAARAWFWGA